MKTIIFSLAVASLFLAGCMNSPIALRSNLYFNPQSVTTEGQITSNPPAGSWSVEAPKTTSDSYKPKTSANVANNAKELSAGGETTAE